MIKRLCPDEVWQPKLGAPRGNRNALKHGKRDSGARALRRHIAAFRRSAKDFLKHVDGEIAARDLTNSRPSEPSPSRAPAPDRAAESPS
jgi:hypothetical protein